MSIDLRALQRADLAAAAALLERCGLHDAARVAGEALLGPAPGALQTEAFAAWHRGDLVGAAAASANFIRILAVDPEARGRGIGISLLAMVESAIAATGAERAVTLAQPGNYLSPGVPVTDRETIGWLERRGYVQGKRYSNLIIDLIDNPKVSAERVAELEARAAAGYSIERASRDRTAWLAAEVAAQFGNVWAFEVERALGADPPGVHVAIDRASGALAAFAAHDGNNRGLGWFGPAGTHPEHRGRGLGELLLLRCLRDIAEAGHDLATIAWVGPREFYDKVAGVIGERQYVVLSRDLKEEPS